MREALLLVLPIAAIASLSIWFLFNAMHIFPSPNNSYQVPTPEPALNKGPVIEQPVVHNRSALEPYHFSKSFSAVPLRPEDGRLGPAIPGIALDNKEHVFVTDSSGSRIVKYDTQGNFITAWGRFGYSVEPYGFNIPMDLAADSHGNVYVVDRQGHKIKIYDNDGKFLNYFGQLVPNECYDENGDTHGALCDSKFSIQPLGITIQEDTSNETSNLILVTDYKIKIFTEEGRFVRAWGENGTDHNLGIPYDIATDSEGNVYSIDIDSRKVQKFTIGGRFLKEWSLQDPGPKYPQSTEVGLDVDKANGIVYVAASNSIQKFDTNGKLLDRWNVTATRIAVNNDGSEIYTIGQWPSKYRINIYDNEGNLLRSFGESLHWPPNDNVIPMLPALPSRIEFDEKEHFVYVQYDKSNSNFNGTLKFEQDGNYISKLSSEEELRVFGSPHDSEGNTYLIDGPFIKKFSKDGQFLIRWGGQCTIYGYSTGTWQFSGRQVPAGEGCVDPDLLGPLQLGDGQFFNPHSLTIDSKDHIYVIDGANNRIQKFDSDGKFLGKVSLLNGTGDATDMAIDGHDNIYVAKSGESSPLIQKLDSNFTLLAAWGSFCDAEFERGCIDPDGPKAPLLPGYGQVHGLMGIDVDGEGNRVYVTDTIAGTENSVFVFKKDGS